VPAAGPTEDTHAIAVAVERAQRVEFDDHALTVAMLTRGCPTSPRPCGH
jgi:hypothetical protein